MNTRLVTVDEIHRAYVTYHEVHFAQKEELPKLDLLIEVQKQHVNIYVGKRSVSQAALLLKLTRQLALMKDVTLMLILRDAVVGNDDYTEAGFVKFPKGWCAVC